MRETQRVDRILSNFGFGTRREIKQLVKNGEVKVDGEVIKDSGMHVDPKTSKIEISGQVLNYRQFIYVMMNKPAGVISATFDNRHETVVDILPEEYKCFDPFPVGRLDIDTEGLLLMTNDGQLAHELLSPRKHVPKKYFAYIEGEVSAGDVKMFEEGILLDDGYKTLPAELHILEQGESSSVEVIIFEGKFHQVKRMFEAVGKKVKYLKRITMGNLVLDEALATGECRELTENELTGLINAVRTENDSNLN
ncbi:pseudouridine synthase [Acetivibrio cellulolyticus]|uniref:pseudouridine synthase n=1 Tax=Acetivibrio cellulolyticus TaxID=35830 RepID=UPI0001E2FBFC|nr:pseudouridine synthase [Acetivibrio cellulolyticus]